MTKGDFAKLSSVTPARVSQWIAAKQIHGDAIVGDGHRARIRIAVAREQLRRGLDPVFAHLGTNGKAKLAGAVADALGGSAGDAPKAGLPENPAFSGVVLETPPETVEDEIKRARLEQLAHSNAKAEVGAQARSGRYVKTDDARQEMGRVAARLMATFRGVIERICKRHRGRCAEVPARRIAHAPGGVARYPHPAGKGSRR